MGVFTFVCRSDEQGWFAKQHAGDLNATSASSYDLQRKLVQAATAVDSSGAVQSSFCYVTPTSAVFQVIIGGAAGGGGGETATTTPACVEPAKETLNVEENKKEDKEDMSEDDDMIMDLFGLDDES